MSPPPQTSDATGRRLGLALFGAVCLLGGLAGVAALAIAVYGASPGEQAWGLRLGLGGSLLASAVAQIFVLLGGWALWRGLRRRS